jgi:hypothetical protein
MEASAGPVIPAVAESAATHTASTAPAAIAAAPSPAAAPSSRSGKKRKAEDDLEQAGPDGRVREE